MTYPSVRRCIDCNEEKLLKDFPMSKTRNKTYHRTRCRNCYNEYCAALPKSTAREDLYGDTIVCIKCKKNKPKLEYYWNTTSGYINKKCKPCFDAANKLNERIAAKRQKGLDSYGAQCNCCGELENAFLTFDHVNDDGAKHRETVRTGWALYKWLEDNNYPDMIQVLCFNCNWGKFKLGQCPHTLREQL